MVLEQLKVEVDSEKGQFMMGASFSKSYVLCYASNFVASINLVTDFPHFFEFLKLKNAAFRRCILLESNFY